MDAMTIVVCSAFRRLIPIMECSIDDTARISSESRAATLEPRDNTLSHTASSFANVISVTASGAE
jgi:hypothetical protein